MYQKITFKKKCSLVRKHAPYYVLLLPMIAYYLIFAYGPMYGVIIAFKDYRLLSGILGSEWVGFKHFAELMTSFSFGKVLCNTLIINAMQIFIGFPMPIVFALFLNELRFPAFKKTVQTISYLPHFISWVILAGIFKDILSPTRGPVNMIIKMLGGTPIDFLTEPSLFRWIILFTGIWQGIGWSSIIYISAMSNIDVELYEAAYIDGSTRLKNMFYITIPSILPVVSILFILRMGGLLSGSFDQIYNLTPILQI